MLKRKQESASKGVPELVFSPQLEESLTLSAAEKKKKMPAVKKKERKDTNRANIDLSSPSVEVPPSSSSFDRRAPFVEKYSSVWPWNCPYTVPSYLSIPDSRASMVPTFNSAKEDLLALPSDQLWNCPYPVGKDETVFADGGVAARLAENSLTPTDRNFLKFLPAEMISASAIMHAQRLSSLLVSLHERTPLVNINDERIEALHKVVIEHKMKVASLESQLNKVQGAFSVSDETIQDLRKRNSSLEGLYLKSEEKANREEKRRKEAEKNFANEKEIMEKQIINLQRNFLSASKGKEKIIKEYEEEVLSVMLDETFTDGFKKCRTELQKVYPDLKVDWTLLNPDAEDSKHDPALVSGEKGKKEMK